MSPLWTDNTTSTIKAPRSAIRSVLLKAQFIRFAANVFIGLFILQDWSKHDTESYICFLGIKTAGAA